MKSLLGLFICLPLLLKSQNLVPNPGFEVKMLPVKGWMMHNTMFDERMKNWSSANQGSPDILFPMLADVIKPKRPHLDITGHRPRNGNYFIGLKTYGCLSRTQHCKEYIQAHLLRPLIKGKKYYVECWVNPARTSPRVNDFGISFSLVRIYEPLEFGIYYMQPFVKADTLLDAPPNEWIRIADTITADKDYEYIVLGSFTPDNFITIDTALTELRYSYYFVDDILVKPLEPSFDESSFKEGIPVVMQNVFFDHNKATLSNTSQRELEFLAETLQSKIEVNLKIVGHTDITGEDESNLQLSRARANAVVNYLIEKGISKQRLKAVGLGSTQPVADNTTPEGRQRNRRVEFVPYFD
jgi:OOP family OmpA-OmpF porin